MWAFLGDGECDEPELLGAISMAGREKLDNLIRHQLQSAAARRPGARQRQDHPGTRKRLSRRRVERHQGVWGSGWDKLFAKDTGSLLLRRMEECVDGQYQDFKSKNGAYVREHFFNSPELKALVADLSDDEVWKLNAAATIRSRSTPRTRLPSSTRTSRR